jgi:hypothetical protein
LTIDPDNPLVIEGASDDMVPIEAVLQSDRLRPYTSQNRAQRRYPGQGGLEIVGGSHLRIRNLKFRDFGLGCLIFSGGGFEDVELEQIGLDNVRRGIWLKDTATFESFKITELVGRGNSRGFIVVEADGTDLEIGKFDLDGDGQTGDNFAKGIHIDGTIDDVWGARLGRRTIEDRQFPHWRQRP